MFKRTVKRSNLRQKRRSNSAENSDDDDTGGRPAATAVHGGGDSARPAGNCLLSFGNDDDADDDVTSVVKSKKTSASKRLEKYKRRLERKRREQEDSEQKPAVKAEDEHGAAAIEHVKIDTNGAGGDRSAVRHGGTPSQPPSEQPPVSFKASKSAIPDADAIFRARQTRAARRKGDYIPLDDTNRLASSGGAGAASRIVRDDDNDRSDEDAENYDSGDGTLPASKRHQLRLAEKHRRERQKLVLQAQEGGSASHSGSASADGDGDGGEQSGDDNEELRRWEREQMRKGVSSSAQLATHAMHAYGAGEADYAAGRIGAGGRAHRTVPMEDVMEIEDEPDLTPRKGQPGAALPSEGVPPAETPVVSWQLQVEAMRKRLEGDESRLSNARLELEKMDSHLEEIDEELAQLENDKPKMELKYHLYQEVSAYVRDIFDCYKHKVPVLEELEKRHGNVHAGTSQFVARRRRQDIRDQFEQCSGRTGPAASCDGQSSGNGVLQTRSGDREARRTRRRQKRQAGALSGLASEHRDGESTDDELLPSRVAIVNADMAEIWQQANALWDDVEEDYCNLSAVMRPFLKWHQVDKDSFDDAFIELCLPKLCAPIVRTQMLINHVFADPPPPLDTMLWHEQLLCIGVDRSLAEDDDYWLPPSDESIVDEMPPLLHIIPNVVEKVVLPKLAEYVHTTWDGTSRRQCGHLAAVVTRLAHTYANMKEGSKQSRRLVDALRSKMQEEIDEDLFMPIYSKDVMENTSLGAAAFANRQFWFAMKVLRNCITLEGVLSRGVTQQLCIDGILNRHLVLGLQLSDPLEPSTLLKCRQIVSALPQAWLKRDDNQGIEKQLQPLLRAIKGLADNVFKARYNSSGTSRILAELHKMLLQLGAKSQAHDMAQRCGLRV